jgi:hypothetical protein
MSRQRHINLDVAVRSFRQNVESLTRLPLLSEADFARLLGGEVVGACQAMSELNQEKRLCADCPKRCCPLVKCELYDTRFSQCPIFEFRPLICRLHYCDRFVLEDPSFIREFADIYVNGLIEAKMEGCQKINLFDSPPLARYALPFLKQIEPVLEDFRRSRIEEKTCLALLREEAEKFSTPNNFMDNLHESAEDRLLWEEFKQSFSR